MPPGSLGLTLRSGTHDELLAMGEDGAYAKLVNRQLTKASNEILSDGAFDESEGESPKGNHTSKLPLHVICGSVVF